MQRVLRRASHLKYVAWLGLVLFTACAVLAPLTVIAEAQPNRKAPVGALAAVAGIFGCFAAACVWLLVLSRRYQLILDTETVVEIGVLRTRALRLDEAVSLEWGKNPKQRILFCTRSLRMRLWPENYDRRDRLLLIRFFRAAIPHDRQRHWPLFCVRVAVPLRDGALARPGTALISKARMACYSMFAMIAVLLPPCVVVWAVTGDFPLRMMATAVCLLPMLLVAPQQGIAVLEPKKFVRLLGVLFAVWWLAFFYAVVLVVLVRKWWPAAEIVCWVPVIAGIVWLGWRFDREWRARDLKAAEAVLPVWEQGEAVAADEVQGQ